MFLFKYTLKNKIRDRKSPLAVAVLAAEEDYRLSGSELEEKFKMRGLVEKVGVKYVGGYTDKVSLGRYEKRNFIYVVQRKRIRRKSILYWNV